MIADLCGGVSPVDKPASPIEPLIAQMIDGRTASELLKGKDPWLRDAVMDRLSEMLAWNLVSDAGDATEMQREILREVYRSRRQAVDILRAISEHYGRRMPKDLHVAAQKVIREDSRRMIEAERAFLAALEVRGEAAGE